MKQKKLIVQMPADFYDKLQGYAEKKMVSMAGILRMLAAEAIERDEGKGARPAGRPKRTEPDELDVSEIRQRLKDIMRDYPDKSRREWLDTYSETYGADCPQAIFAEAVGRE